MKRENLEHLAGLLFESGLVEKPNPPVKRATSDENLIRTFEEINEFVTDFGREPEVVKEIHEFQLAKSLQGIRENHKSFEILKDYDKHGLLTVEKSKLDRITELMDVGDSKRFDAEEDNNIFDTSTLPKSSGVKNKPDFIARRKKCQDFHLYENLFVQCHADLESGNRTLREFSTQSKGPVMVGDFFIVRNVLTYVAQIGKLKKSSWGQKNGRLRCIFENGMESDMLLRSLEEALYKNGSVVSNPKESFAGTLEESMCGTVYVLESLNDDVKDIENLHKIGYTDDTITNRIKNAKNDPTYLMAPVKVLKTFACKELNARKVENDLHDFFGASCLDIEIIGNDKKRHRPREWFIAPREIIEDAVQKVIDGSIVNFYYDSIKRKVVRKK